MFAEVLTFIIKVKRYLLSETVFNKKYSDNNYIIVDIQNPSESNV